MKILIVLPRFPYPLEKGDKLRAYHQIVQLGQRHDLYLFCLSHTAVSDASLAALRPYCKAIHVQRLRLIPCAVSVLWSLLRGRSLQIGYWTTRRARRACRDFEASVSPDVVYCQMIRTMPYAATSPRPKVMDFQDALSMNLERRLGHSRGPLRLILRYELRAVRAAERQALSLFDALTIISPTDAAAIPQVAGRDISIVPNGIDTLRFSTRPCQKQADILFTGNMGYAPNISAAHFLVQQVMPIVWAAFPDATVQIVGAAPTRSVRSLADGRRVVVSGFVSDIALAYASARLFVAPMLIGSGLQNKLLEAMAMQLPCITTTIAAAPLGATPGQHLLVADTAQALADAIIALLSCPAEADALALRGHQYVCQNFGWSSAVQKLEKILNEAHLEKR